MTRAFALVLAFAAGGCGAEEDRATGVPASEDASTAGTDASSSLDGGFTAASDAALGPETVLDEADQAVLRIANKAQRAFTDHAEAIYSADFRFDRTPIVLLRRQAGEGSHALLVNHPEVDGAEKLALSDELSALGRVQRAASLAEYPPPEAPFEFSFEGSGTDAFLIAYRHAPGDPFDDLASPDWLYYYVHEGFHRFQIVDEQWPEVPGATQDLEAYPFGPENAALAMLENRALLAALEASDAATREKAIVHFLAAREERRARFALVHELDENQEKHEGSARYMETRLSEVLGEAPLVPLSVEDQLAMDSDPAMVGPYAGDIFGFGRFYATGAAILILLDALDVEWKTRMPESNTTPADLLRTERSAAVSDASLEEAKAAHRYAELLEAASGFDFQYDDAY